MKKENFKVGKKVKYYPILGYPEFIVTEIKTEPWECCCSLICRIDGISSGVDIENLEEYYE